MFPPLSPDSSKANDKTLTLSISLEFYRPEGDECAEADLYIVEESTSAFESDKLPVRLLTSYTIYDLKTARTMPLPLLDIACGASGYVRPKFMGLPDIEDNDSDIEDALSSGELTKLTKILEIYLDTDNYIEPEIWLRTAFSWYILDRPSDLYRPYLDCIYVPHLLTCALAAKYGSKLCSDQEVINALDCTSGNGPAYYAFEVLGRPLTLDDFLLVETEVRENLRTLGKTKRPADLAVKGIDGYIPFVTEIVGKIAEGLFYRVQAIADNGLPENLSLRNICVSEDPFVAHRDNPARIKWGRQVPNVPNYFQSVYLDGVEYNVGDTVAVEPGRDANRTREVNASMESSRTRNELGNQAWFCIILYFFAESAEISFHGRWFQHGSQTVLAETANPQGLFLLDLCDSNPVSSIIQKIQVHQLSVDDTEPIILAEQDIGSSSFHFAFKWREEQFAFTDPAFDTEEALVSLLCHETHRACYPCALKYQKDLLSNCVKTARSLDLFGQTYHRSDFVYIKAGRSRLRIAQITDLMPDSESSEIGVCFYSRSSKAGSYEMRKLVPTAKSIAISADLLDGHCRIANENEIADLDAWVQNNDHFFVAKQTKIMSQCQICNSAHTTRTEAEKAVKSRKTLKSLDLFAGAGGLSTGLNLSGFAKTCWAVESSPSASSSFKTNHPDVKVYNQDCNALLKHAAELRDGKNPKPLKSLGNAPGRQQLPPLPSPGEVDLIIGGPPCQAFSGMNHYKKADDVRLTLIPTMVSYVEFYRPKYVLIENVTGLLNFRLQGEQKGRRIVGGIESGVVKFIMRAFTSLGYQIQVRILNAADYGSPQQRNRVIFWAAQIGIPLPKWPAPTHIPKAGRNHTIRKVSSIGHIPSPSRHPLDTEEGHQHAPFYSVTVLEAIDDLPEFDWQNPGLLLPDKQTLSERRSFPADKDVVSPEYTLPGFDYPVLYGHEPRSLYQAWSRSGLSIWSRVTHQCTACFPSAVVERTVNIPLHAGADYSDLPPGLRRISEGVDKGAKGSYRRLDGDGQFRTMLTTVQPQAKGAAVLHPTQKRVLTVRECARAQGFPDSYEFVSVETRRNRIIQDLYVQIGNAVPVPLALALGKALGEGLIQDEIDRRFEDEDNDTVMSEEL
ncbi:hypothetical protein M0805_007182 [Coniferiporia weirii]|nr:hypothetical protein M0805_007182 [Coniferiporia weirii]